MTKTGSSLGFRAGRLRGGGGSDVSDVAPRARARPVRLRLGCDGCAYRFYDQVGQQPLFPFGFGRSHARFAFDDLDVHRRGDDIVARVRVRNVSDRAGSAVAQAYVSFPRAAGEPPWQLKGYEKVRLTPGRSERVTFRLHPANDLNVFDEAAHRFVVVPGRYTLAVGASSRDLAERESFVLSARRRR